MTSDSNDIEALLVLYIWHFIMDIQKKLHFECHFTECHLHTKNNHYAVN